MVRPANILVVEDHADSARALARLLSSEGHHVSHAEGYATAMQMAQSQRFDLLLTDLGLPDGDGCALLAEMRSLYHVPAIAVTGYGMAPDVRRCRDAGFDAHILKPIKAQVLFSSIERVLVGQPLTTPTAQPVLDAPA
jgi:CheY-like chemotaxis protein